MATAAATSLQGDGDSMNTGGIRFVGRAERFLEALALHRHNWSFPISTAEMKRAYRANAPYDSHQQCPECGALRLYNQKTMHAGPQFTREPKTHG